MDRDKKISFGFSKLSKKPAVIQNKRSEQEKVELVECLEGQSIKIKDPPVQVSEPLVIPLKDNKNILLDRVKDSKTKQKQLDKQEAEQEDNRPDSELTLDELAARELINDARNRSSNKKPTKGLLVLAVKDDNSTFEGEKEPTLDDYEKIPVSDYGMALLRGMGWKEGMGIGRNSTKIQPANLPELRPKGLGLGASRMVKAEIPNEPAYDKDGKMLIIKKGTYVKIIAGSHKGKYCEVQGLDDEAGRVIVRTSLKSEVLTLNEFLIVPITKEEYFKESKVLNNAKFEEYKEISDNNFASHLKAKGTSKEDTERNSRGKHNENGYYVKSRKHESEREVNEKTDKHNKDEHHSKHESHSRYRENERDLVSSNSDNDGERKRWDKKKQKTCGDRSRSSESKHKSEYENFRNNTERISSSDYHRKDTSKTNKSKSRYGSSSSRENDTDYRKNKR